MSSRETDPLTRFANTIESRPSARGDLPRRSELESFTAELLGLFFPELAPAPFTTPVTFSSEARRVEQILTRFIEKLCRISPQQAQERAADFFSRTPAVYELLCKDAEAICEGDPAAGSVDEVVLTYPGFFAIAVYRFAHILRRLEIPILPRAMTEYAHRMTGIDINPGAEIGERFCIDHGTGIVIGETARIGKRVKLYQGVTLGALSVEKSLADQRRHPTLGDQVVVYANATILGGATHIGENSVIGGNVWLTESVPANSTVYHKGEVTVRRK